MFETERLYYKDVDQKTFEARVMDCRSDGDTWKLILDRSCFYPEGGGQPSDLGVLGDAKVLHVIEEGEELIHRVDRAVEPGTIVTGTIDWRRRFDLMQQHSGEHIVSGLVHEKYGWDNVGFHMGSDMITVDFSGPVTMEQLKEIEAEANEIISRNEEVQITYPSEEELKTIPYRSKKELTGEVRIVIYPGADICACCGTHVKRTGEIGAVYILSVEKFHDGVRMEMIAGERIIKYLNMVAEQNNKISVLTSSKPQETAAAVQRIQEENFALKGKNAKLLTDSFAAEAEKYEGAGSVLLFKEEMEADHVRRLCDAVMQTCAGCCAVFSKNPDGSYKYAMGEIDGDLRAFVKEMNRELNGRGGGRPFFVQGSVKALESEIRNFFER